MDHTPGPWEIDGKQVVVKSSDEQGEFVEVICTSHCDDNRRLIRTAPEMFNALVLAVNDYVDERSIDPVTGEPTGSEPYWIQIARQILPEVLGIAQ